MLNRRLAIQLGPALIAEAIAVAVAASVDPLALRFALQGLAVALALGMAWRGGMVIDELGTLVSSSAAPTMTRDRRRPVFDPDTGMCASWYFRLRVEEEIERTKRYEQPFTIVTASARSKRSYEACRAAMKKHLRQVDIASDFGDKIVAMMPNTSRAAAQLAVKRLRSQAKGIQYKVAEYPGDGVTLSQLLGEQEWQLNQEAIA